MGYIELHLGKKPFRTSCAENPSGESSVGFNSERALFVYSGESDIEVSCSDKRGVQAAFRGDPLIGKGSLRLDPSLSDCLPRWADVLLQRGENAAGCVSLRYQLLKVADGGVVSSAATSCMPLSSPRPSSPSSTTANFNPTA